MKERERLKMPDRTRDKKYSCADNISEIENIPLYLKKKIWKKMEVYGNFTTNKRICIDKRICNSTSQK